MVIKATFLTHYGNFRLKNEDSILLGEEIIYDKNMEYPEEKILDGERILLCVADGMGGHSSGELASRSVLFFLRENIDKITNIRSVKKTLFKSKELLNGIAMSQDFYGLGTTLSGMYLKNGKAIVFHCGDSRIYRIENGSLEKLTSDHSVVQSLYDSGFIDEEEMRTHPQKNLLTSAIIGDLTLQEPTIQVKEINVFPGNKFLLCTDGLWESMRSDELQSIYFSEPDLSSKALSLKDASLERGGRDNISLIIFEVMEE